MNEAVSSDRRTELAANSSSTDQQHLRLRQARGQLGSKDRCYMARPARHNLRCFLRQIHVFKAVMDERCPLLVAQDGEYEVVNERSV